MKYGLYLKNPYWGGADYDEEVDANSKEEAVDIFYQDLGKYGWDIKTLEQSTMEVQE